MMRHGMRAAAQVVYCSDHIEFYLADYRGGRRFDAQSVVFEEGLEGAPAAPVFRLQMDAAQELFEQLWAQGLRSKHDRGNADRLDAARAEHIADLRRAAKLDREPAAK